MSGCIVCPHSTLKYHLISVLVYLGCYKIPYRNTINCLINDKYLCLSVQETEKSKIKGPASGDLVEAFLLHHLMAVRQREREKERKREQNLSFYEKRTPLIKALMYS